MNKTRLTILPILGVIFAFFCGWSTIFGQAAEKLENQIREINALPAGSVFALTVTDDEISDAANEYLDRYIGEIQKMIENAVGTKLTLSDPVVEFKTEKTYISLKVSKGFLKVTLSIQAEVYWDGSLHVNVTSVELPIISIDADTINAYIQEPVDAGMRYLQNYIEIRSLTVGDGQIALEAVKK